MSKEKESIWYKERLKRPFTFENEWWHFFGYGVTWPPDKCSRCLELVETHKKPNRHCINCWKLEIFFSNCTDLQAVKDYFLEEAKRDTTLSGKWLKKPMEMPEDIKGKITSIPKEGHPDPGVNKDGAILIYTQSIAEREEKGKRILAGLKERGLYKKSEISYRRGCLNFDEIIGPWKTWWSLDKDYNEEEEVVKGEKER